MTLRLNGDGSGFTEIKAADTAGDNSIKLPAGNGSANELLKNGGTAGELEFASDVVVDSSNRLLVGTSTFAGAGGGAQLQVIQNDTGDLRTITMGSTAVDQKLHLGAFSSGTSYITWGGYYYNGWTTDDTANTFCIGAIQLTALTTGSDITFRTQTSPNTSPADRIRIKSNGALALLDDCPGIDFSGIQAAAVNGSMTSETLDTYETGTWTPSFQGATTAGTYTYGSRAGIYTKVGNIVIVSFSLVNINTSTAGVGTATITGLPFTSTSSFSYNSSPPRFDNFDIGTNTAYVTMLVDNNSTRIKFFTVRNNGSDGVLSVTSKNSDTSDVFGTLMYLT